MIQTVLNIQTPSNWHMLSADQFACFLAMDADIRRMGATARQTGVASALLVSAFVYRSDEFWRRAVRMLDELVSAAPSPLNPARSRLAQFVAENADLLANS
jgi:hypothetical protein